MKMIVCVSQNYGIGNKGELLFSLPPDMKLFRETTLNKVVVMGRSTLDSFPGGKALKNRINVVLTRDKSFERENTVVFNSKEAVLEYVKQFESDDVYVIGGAQIYSMFRPDCDEAIVTKVRKQPRCDTFFFDIDSDKEWTKTDESDVMEYEGTLFTFCKYRRIS